MTFDDHELQAISRMLDRTERLVKSRESLCVAAVGIIEIAGGTAIGAVSGVGAYPIAPLAQIVGAITTVAGIANAGWIAMKPTREHSAPS